MQILTDFIGLFSWFAATKPTKKRELIFVEYEEAELLLAADQGWRIAPEEDTNRQFRQVYLERFI